MAPKANHAPYTIATLQQAYSRGRSVQSVVQAYLDAIATYDSEINAFNAVNLDALSDAARLDELEEDDRGPLFGVPVILKDQIETADIPTTFGSIACAGYVAAEDALLVKRLKGAGAIIIGKATMPDWAASWFSTSSVSGVTKNPHDFSRDPGGSSSGCAAALAADMAVIAIGGDTSGSARLPASLCGLVGMRPTPGRVSRRGMSPLYSVQDTPAPMAKSVGDIAVILDILVGFDKQDDFTSINAIKPVGSFTAAVGKPSLKGKRLGVLRPVFGSHHGVVDVVESALTFAKDAGADLIDVTHDDIDWLSGPDALYPSISREEINAFLASKDGLTDLTIEDIYARGLYDKHVGLIETFATSPDSSKDPHFATRLLRLAKMQRAFASLYAEHDLDAIVYPTCQTVAPKTSDVLNNRYSNEVYPTNTIIASQLLFCAISVPVGTTVDTEGDPKGPALPVGLEILGLPLDEERLLAVAAGIEAAVPLGERWAEH